MQSGDEFEASVLFSRSINAHQCGNEEIGICAPSRLLILVQLEAITTRQFEVDLVFVEYRFFT